MAADEMKDQEGDRIPWTDDAQALLKKVPFFIRKNVEKEAEDYARSHGMSRVEASVIVRIKASKAGEGGEVSESSSSASDAVPSSSASMTTEQAPSPAAETSRTSESAFSRQAQIPPAGGLREFASFVVLRVDPEWRKVHPAEVGHGKKEFSDVIRNFDNVLASSSYSLVGLSGIGDILLWRVGTNISLLQEMTGKLLSTYLGRYLTVEKSFLGLLGEGASRSPFSPKSSRFIHLRPVVRTKDWHLQVDYVRDGIERERKAVIDRFPGVRVTMASSFGLDESDILMIMESDAAELIVDLNQALQETQENRYLHTSFRGITGVSRPLGEVLDMLGGV